MNSGWPSAVMISGGLALLAGIAYCVLAVKQRRRISDRVSIHLTGALLTAMVAIQLMNVWLGINLRTGGMHGFDDDAWYAAMFAARPFWLMIYLFSALLGHFMIYSTGQLVAERRARTLTRPTLFSFASATTTLVAAAAMAWFLWRSPYAVAQKEVVRQIESRALTARYLEDWLKAEPDSPHAQQLHRAFTGIPAPQTQPE